VNAADHFAKQGWQVRLFDNLSRAGSDQNLAWIGAQHPSSLDFRGGDVRDSDLVTEAVRGVDAVLHLAAQVAVTTSLADPLGDFAINLTGTLHVLEAVRRGAPEATVVFASTNKVYGELEDLDRAVTEDQPLDFRTPYGCSKGAADQYVHDYGRSFGLRTVVLRQSCIYGRHQNGSEDQGWVAHFVHSILAGRPLTIYGDGHQVRDLLDARDLCRLYELAVEPGGPAAGQVFNVGGGPSNARDLLQVIAAIEDASGRKAEYEFAEVRPGDQRRYVSDLASVTSALNWRPEIDVDAGLADMIAWARSVVVT